MPATSLYTAAHAFRRVLATNSTANAYTAKADTTTVPAALPVDSAGGYLDLTAGATVDFAPNAILLKFYGATSNGQTGNARIYGVRPIKTAAGGNVPVSYTHVLLADFAFTLSSTITGVVGGAVGASELYADTITRTTGNANVSDQLVSPTSGVPAHVLVNTKGFNLVLVELIVGTATNVNALWAGV